MLGSFYFSASLGLECGPITSKFSNACCDKYQNHIPNRKRGRRADGGSGSLPVGILERRLSWNHFCILLASTGHVLSPAGGWLGDGLAVELGPYKQPEVPKGTL